MYSVTNFLESYLPTSKTLRILYSDGSVSFTIIVCNYQKSSVTGSVLNIVLEGSVKNYELNFNSHSEAKQALTLFTQAIDLLKPNCGSGGGFGGASRFGLEDIIATNDRAFNAQGHILDIKSTDSNDIGTELQLSNSALTQNYTSGTTQSSFVLNGAINLQNTNGTATTSIIISSTGIQLYSTENGGFNNITNKVLTTDASGNLIFTTPQATLASDITVNVGAGQSVGGAYTGTTFTAGSTLESVLDAILVKEVHPTYVAPTLVLTSGFEGNYEIGTVLSPSFDVTFTQNDAGAENAEELTKDGSAISTSFPYTDTNFQILNSEYLYQAELSYNAGATKTNNLGQLDTTGKISAGTILSNTLSFKGYRKAFYGTPSVPVLSSNDVRGLANNMLLLNGNGDTFTITIPQGATYVIFAYPDTLEDVSSVQYQELSFSEVKSLFTKTIISVEGANGVASINYKVYTYQPIEGFPVGVHYIVKI